MAMQHSPEVNPAAFTDVVGVETDSGRMGAIGSNIPDKAFGFLAGNDLVFHQHAGVYGQSDQQGVMGIGTTPTSTGVFGGSKDGAGFGLRGETRTGVAVLGRTFGTGLAGRFIGDVEVTGDIRLVNADLAEDFTTSNAVDPGTVMVLDNEGRIEECRAAYDKRAAGVISGAGEYRAAIVLDRQNGLPDRAAIALVGKVYCKVDAAYGPVETGDLLTTSPTPGHAMKALDPTRAFGTVIGKALRPHADGRGMIPILVSLQ